MNRIATLAALLLAPVTALAAGDRIAILSPQGASGVRAQLIGTLCVSEDCIDANKVMTAGKLDLAKMAREHVGSVVTGKAVAHDVELSVMNVHGGQRGTARAALGNSGILSIRDLVSVSAQMLTAIESPSNAQAKPAAAAHPKHASRPHAKTSRRMASRGHTLHARG